MKRLLVLTLILCNYITFSQNRSVPKRNQTIVNVFVKNDLKEGVSTSIELIGVKTGVTHKLKTDKKGYVQFITISGESFEVNLKDSPNYDLLCAEKDASHLYNFQIRYNKKSENPTKNPLAHMNLQPTSQLVVAEVSAKKFVGDSIWLISYTSDKLSKHLVRSNGFLKVHLNKGEYYSFRFRGHTLLDSVYFPKDPSIRTIALAINQKTIEKKKNSLATKAYAEALVKESYEAKNEIDLTTLLNPTWKHILIVSDVTGSMYPYLANIADIHKDALSTKNAEIDFAFFNDGNSTPDEEKIIGKTGGIYIAYGSEKADFETTLTTAISNGGGGDSPENDIEAILFALSQSTKTYDKIFLIADNYSSVRDISLAPQIKQAIDIILFDTESHPNYLELARITNGSIIFK